MTYDATDNARKCYAEAIAAMRERQIRAGILRPRPDNETEMRWAAEGPARAPRPTNDNAEAREVPFG